LPIERRAPSFQGSAIARPPSIFRRHPLRGTQGPLAILWVGIGLCCFYIALVWLNTLLGFFLTPLFLIPATWLMDRKKRREERREDKRNA
jgi:hypothetical protein